MVAYNPPNQSHTPKSNGKVIGGTIIMILGIVIFFCSIFIPITFDNIFLMFPFFFGGFIIIIIGVVTLTIGIRNRSIASGNFLGSRMMGRYMTWTNKIFRNQTPVNYQQNPVDRYGQAYNTSRHEYKSGKQEETTVRTRNETICSYCGTSNNIENEFCIGCNSKLKN